MNDNGTQFGFINEFGNKLKELNYKVGRLIDGFNNEELYMIDYENLIKEYWELGVGDIDEFCSSYTFGRHIGQPFDSQESREAMYLKIRDFLWDLKRNGHLEEKP